MTIRRVARFALASGIPSAVNLGAILIYTRLLGPGAYGKYAVFVAAVGLLNAFGFQWLRSGARRFIAAHLDRSAEFRTTLIGCHLLVSSGAMVLGLVAAAVRPDLAWLSLAVVLVGIVQSWAELGLELSLVKGDAARYGGLMLGRSVAGLVTGAGLMLAGWGPLGAGLGFFAGYALIGALQSTTEWRGVRPALWTPEFARELLHYGLPLVLTFALFVILDQSDRILLATLHSTEAAGNYAVANDLGQRTLTTIMMTVNLGLFPLAVHTLEVEGRVAVQPVLERQAVVFLAVALPAACGLALLARNIAGVMLGPAFRDAAARLLPIVAFGGFVGGLKAYYFDLGFQLGRATRGQLAVGAVAAIVNVGLNLWWIPRWGAVGSALASATALLFGCVLSAVVSRSAFPMPRPYRGWGSVGSAAAIMVIALVPFRDATGLPALLMQVAFGGAVYLASLVAFNTLGSRDFIRQVARERSSR